MLTEKPLQPIAQMEVGLIARILAGGDWAFADAATIVSAEHFHTAIYRLAWGWMTDAFVRGVPVSTESLAASKSHLPEFTALMRGMSELSDVPDVIGAMDIREAANQLKDRAALRNATTAALDLAKMAVAASTLDELRGAVESLSGALFHASSAAECVTVKQVIREMELDEANPQPQAQVFPTGFPTADGMMAGGLREENMMVLAGPTGGGKTSLALNMVTRLARAGHGVAVISLEMSRKELVNRMARAEGGRDAIREFPIRIVDSPDITAEGISTMARLLRTQYGVSVIVVDYLQLLRESGRRDTTREREVSEMARTLKVCAKRDKIAIVVLSQVNEKGLLRESRAVSQHADFEAHILTDDARYWLRICKNRHGRSHGTRSDADEEIEDNKSPGIELDFHAEKFLFLEEGQTIATPNA